MSGASLSATQGATQEVGAYREPANGDYVAYLAMIERHQLAQLVRGQARPPARPSAPLARSSGKLPTHSTLSEPAVLMNPLALARTTVGQFGTGQIVTAVIGAVLVLVTLVGEGSFVTLLIGIALLWSPVKQVLRLLRRLAPRTNGPSIDTRFGKSNR